MEQNNTLKKYNTIDLDIHPDYINKGKSLLEKVMRFIKHCEYCLAIGEPQDSNSKGYHIFFICKKDCELCRLLFDDSRRYMMDFDRLEERKNVMFDVKYCKIDEAEK